MSYTSEGDVENLLLQDIDASFSTWIAVVITMAEEYIDQYCGTTFANSGAGLTKYYNGSGTEELTIDEFQSLTSVNILDETGVSEQSLVENTDYWTYPLNDLVKNKLTLSKGGSRTMWPSRARAVKIVGTFGRATVPPTIRLVAAKLAAKVLNEGLKGGQVKSETLGSYSITMKDIDEKANAMEIFNILDMYRNMRLD